MRDQAHELRRLVEQARGTPLPAPHPAPRAVLPPVILAASGKGGDGTTTAALHVALALRRQGHRVALVEADPQGGHLALLCRLQPRATLADVLTGRSSVLEAVQSGPAGMLILPGQFSLPGPEDATTPHPRAWLAEFAHLPHPPQAIVIDGGSGSSENLRRLWDVADAALVVLTPAAASAINAYALLKLLAGSQRAMPAIHCLVNRAANAQQAAGVQCRLADACRRFLELELRDAGLLPDSPHLDLQTACQGTVPCGPPGPAGDAELLSRLDRLAADLLRDATRRAHPSDGDVKVDHGGTNFRSGQPGLNFRPTTADM